MASLLDQRVTGVPNPFNVALEKAQTDQATQVFNERNAFNLIFGAFQGMPGEDQQAFSELALGNPQFSAFLDRQGIPQGFGATVFKPFNPTTQEALQMRLLEKVAGRAPKGFAFKAFTNEEGIPEMFALDKDTAEARKVDVGGSFPVISGSELTVDADGNVTFRQGGAGRGKTGLGQRGEPLVEGSTLTTNEKTAADLGLTVEELVRRRESVQIGEQAVSEMEQLLEMSQYLDAGVVGNVRNFLFEMGSLLGLEVFPSTPEFRNKLNSVKLTQLATLDKAVDERRFLSADRDAIADLWGDATDPTATDLVIKKRIFAIMDTLHHRTRHNAGQINTQPVYTRSLMDLITAPRRDVTDPRFLPQERVNIAIESHARLRNEFIRWMKAAEREGKEISSLFKVKE